MDKNEISKENFRVLRFLLTILIPLAGLFFILDIPFLVAKVSVFNQQFLAIFWALVTSLLFLCYPAKRGGPRNIAKWYDLVLAALAMVIGLYAAINYPKILYSMGRVRMIQVVFGVIATILILESVRRTAGPVVVCIVAVFLVYAKFGHLLRGILGTGYITWQRLFQQMYLGADFMLGVPLKVVGQIVFGFILFGVVFLKIGGGDVLMDLAYAAMGRFRGGPAKVAVIASTLFGSISGSAVANVAATGMITIPLMKKTGYPAYYAGSVEAVASTGGQVMPPIMGAAAFVLAEFLGLPYANVVLVAIIPALLYYIGLFIQIDMQAVKLALKGLPPDQIPSMKKTLKEGWMYLLPLVVLVYALFVLFMPAGQAAMLGAATSIIISLIKPSTRKNFNRENIKDMLWCSSKAMFEVVSICAGAGLIVGLVAYTGLGLSFSTLLTKLAGGNLFLLAVITAIASVILGMGMPTTAAYIMLAVLAAPAMVSLGICPLTAHMFVFYFGTLSMLTPPVCLSVFAAASISEAPSMKIAWKAMQLAIAGYVVPFVFIFNEGVLLCGGPLKVVSDVGFTLVSICIFAFAFEGYFLTAMKWFERILFCAAAVLLVFPNPTLRIIGGIIGAVTIIINILERRSLKIKTAT